MYVINRPLLRHGHHGAEITTKRIKQNLIIVITGHPISDKDELLNSYFSMNLMEINGILVLKWENYGIIGVDAGLAGIF